MALASSDVVANTNATALQYNNLRLDVRTTHKHSAAGTDGTPIDNDGLSDDAKTWILVAALAGGIIES